MLILRLHPLDNLLPDLQFAAQVLFRQLSILLNMVLELIFELLFLALVYIGHFLHSDLFFFDWVVAGTGNDFTCYGKPNSAVNILRKFSAHANDFVAINLLNVEAYFVALLQAVLLLVISNEVLVLAQRLVVIINYFLIVISIKRGYKLNKNGRPTSNLRPDIGLNRVNLSYLLLPVRRIVVLIVTIEHGDARRAIHDIHRLHNTAIAASALPPKTASIFGIARLRASLKLMRRTGCQVAVFACGALGRSDSLFETDDCFVEEENVLGLGH